MLEDAKDAKDEKLKLTAKDSSEPFVAHVELVSSEPDAVSISSKSDKSPLSDAQELIPDLHETNTARADGVASEEHQLDHSAECSTESSSTNVIEQRFAGMISNLPSHFEVLSVLGEGGMGAVFKVRDKRVDKLLAIKMLKLELTHDDQALIRFSREAKAAQALTHVNLAAVYDYGIGEHGAPYLVMDYLEGDNLETIIKKEDGLSVPRAVGYFVQMADAVGHAHTRGVVHRDLKPSNMIIETNSAGVELVKLVDFGIAKSLLGSDAGKTRTGDVLGSPPYMSPEQCEGLKLDARSDIYSLGCVMYETLSGKPPFTSKSPIQIILKHVREEPISIAAATTTQTISPDLDYIIMRCLRKDREDRYQNSKELFTDLQRFQQGKQVARVAVHEQRKTGTSRRSIKEVLHSWASRNPEEVMRDVGAVIFSLLVIGLGWGYINDSQRTDKEQPTASSPATSKTSIAPRSTTTTTAITSSTAVTTHTQPVQAMTMLHKIAAKTRHVDLATVYPSKNISPNLGEDAENISAEAIYLAAEKSQAVRASRLFDFVTLAQPPNLDASPGLQRKIIQNEFNAALCHELIPDRAGAALHYNKMLAFYNHLPNKSQQQILDADVATEIAYSSRWAPQTK